jgi:hypothetical protein
MDAQIVIMVIPNITTTLAAEFTEAFNDSITFSFTFAPSYKKNYVTQGKIMLPP